MRAIVTKLFFEKEEDTDYGWDNPKLREWMIGQEFEAVRLTETDNWDYLAFSDMLDDIDKTIVLIFDPGQIIFVSQFFRDEKYPNILMTFQWWPEDCLELIEG